jgi:hypothetical protein
MVVKVLESAFEKNLDVYQNCLIRHLIVEEHAWWDIPSMRRNVVETPEEFDIGNRNIVLQLLRQAGIPGVKSEWWDDGDYAKILRLVFEMLDCRKDELNVMFTRGFKKIPVKGTKPAMDARVRFVALGEGGAVDVVCLFATAKKRDELRATLLAEGVEVKVKVKVEL